jgi:hypothetical protein
LTLGGEAELLCSTDARIFGPAELAGDVDESDFSGAKIAELRVFFGGPLPLDAAVAQPLGRLL